MHRNNQDRDGLQLVLGPPSPASIAGWAGPQSSIPSADTARNLGFICWRNHRIGPMGHSSHLPSGHLHGYRTKIVALADVNAVVTQNRIGGRNMEMKVRQQKVVEVIGALHVTLIVRAERERDLSIGR
jgi:hypothetical protein